jgi:hypothetical protein
MARSLQSNAYRNTRLAVSMVPDCSLAADDGSRYESLFNNFKSSDNPTWK